MKKWILELHLNGPINNFPLFWLYGEKESFGNEDITTSLRISFIDPLLIPIRQEQVTPNGSKTGWNISTYDSEKIVHIDKTTTIIDNPFDHRVFLAFFLNVNKEKYKDDFGDILQKIEDGHRYCQEWIQKGIEELEEKEEKEKEKEREGVDIDTSEPIQEEKNNKNMESFRKQKSVGVTGVEAQAQAQIKKKKKKKTKKEHDNIQTLFELEEY